MRQQLGEGGAAVPASAPREDSPRRQVLLVDAPQARVRRPADLIALILSAVGIVVVLILAVYANATTQGVTKDVQSAVADVLRQVLLVPVTVLQGIVTLFVPLAVLVDRLIRRSWRSALEAAITAVVAGLLAVGAVWLIDAVGPSALVTGLTISNSQGHTHIALNPFVAAIAGLLTAVGDRSHNRTLGWSWILLWVVLGLGVVQGEQTLPGALVTVLLGRCAGLGMRYASGVLHERATGVTLVRGLRRAGVDPVRVVRVDPLLPSTPVQAWTVTTSAPIGYTEKLPEGAAPGVGDAAAAAGHEEYHSSRPGRDADLSPAELLAAVDQEGGTGDTIVPDVLTDPQQILAEVASSAAITPESEGTPRLYAVWDADGRRHDVTVLDGDRHVVGYLSGLWESIRLRGFSRHPARTLREAADSAALMALATRAAGVRTPALIGITEARDSVLMVTEHLPGSRPLDELAPEEIDEDLLDEVWAQVRAAHARGIAHRDLHAGSVVVDRDRHVWLVSWENGEIISTELARRIDFAQLLAMLGMLVGTERALASAARVLTRDQMASMAPLLQPVALPGRTRAAAKDHKDLLASLRAELVDLIPTADVPPVQLARFSPRTVITVTVGVVALWVLFGSLNFQQVAESVRGASVGWMIAAFLLGMTTYVGSAMSLVAFTPEKLGLWRTTLVQIAASVIALVAPAGIGPAAVDLRFLTKQKVATAMAAATVGLVQLSRFVTTVLLLVAVALATGSAGTLGMPSSSVVVVVAGVLVVVGVLFLIPRLREWVWEKVAPTLRQAWPRLVWVASNPRRLLVGIAGNLILTAGYVAAFGASLAAFGYQLPLTSLAITYLASNSLGSVIPSPGGIGPVEAALTGGLALAGIPGATAVSVSIVFRLLTFWLCVPLGWAALRLVQRRGIL
ncbi:lysylphosphatidylglycerol synthase transmembrane domain-containing protein [Georgenia thermotolerans]|uniref:Phosphotransferase n=1 Tax=Georgenia thermotolerans TaxID=527326 RepID=A0A7J5UPY0_9MICO|nr:lysylphosphatidylglycerol synthase transmembrane domain-containing protein [Georgenia thermotolerans]KAE8764478.1 phosphotransferase [Georgenia thermotolerans]